MKGLLLRLGALIGVSAGFTTVLMWLVAWNLGAGLSGWSYVWVFAFGMVLSMAFISAGWGLFRTAA